MADQDKGEHSRRRDPNNDEKPLKKARYEWEVKGKYHLKESHKTANATEKNNNKNEKTDINYAPIGDKQTSPRQCNNIEHIRQCFLSDIASDDEEWSNKNIDQCISNEIPVTLVSPNPKNQDYYLRKWQARRVARGFVDNTINSILENWMNPPIDFDAADFVENCDNDGQVEDEGILMAIQSHGLQSGSNENVPILRVNELNSKDITEMSESTLDNFENYQHELNNTGISSAAASLSNSYDIKNTNECHPFQIDDQMDFLNAAVSVAIEKKGLSSYSF